jgi:GTP diphosphokinase / guanosine-3',5'-bis(diphosphate) 3'-diphosphatase
VTRECTEEVSLILRALKYAALKHCDQRRKDERASPYINHPITVAETLWQIGGVRDVATVVAGILHDVMEDTDTARQELEKEFGAEIGSIVQELTDDKQLPKALRKRRQLENAPHLTLRARQVRIADKISNLTDIIHSPPARWPLERRKEYIEWAGNVVDALRGTNPTLEQCFDRLLAEARETLAQEMRAQPLTG